MAIAISGVKQPVQTDGVSSGDPSEGAMLESLAMSLAVDATFKYKEKFEDAFN